MALAGEYADDKEIRKRTFRFALRIVALAQHLDARPGVCRTLNKQIIRSGTSIGANTEEAKASHGKSEFIYKIEISLKEARETHYWLRLLQASKLIPSDMLAPMIKEADEICRVLAAIILSVKRKPGGSN